MDSEYGSAPHGSCQCGCGKRTKIATKTTRRWGWVKGEPVPFAKGCNATPHNSYKRRSPLDLFLSRVEPHVSGCWLWTGSGDGHGYGQTVIGHGKGKRTEKAHRVSYRFFRGPITDGLFVCHRCDVRNCVRPDHLFLGTNEDNMKDAKRKGRVQRGSQRPMAKLTEDAVRSLKRRYPGVPVPTLAAEYGVSREAVYDALAGRTWAHVR